MNPNIVKLNYERGLWSEAMVRLAAAKGVITEEQCREILSEKDEADA